MRLNNSTFWATLFYFYMRFHIIDQCGFEYNFPDMIKARTFLGSLISSTLEYFLESRKISEHKEEMCDLTILTNEHIMDGNRIKNSLMMTLLTLIVSPRTPVIAAATTDQIQLLTCEWIVWLRARAAFADSRQTQHASQLLTNDAVVDYCVYARDNAICDFIVLCLGLLSSVRLEADRMWCA